MKKLMGLLTRILIIMSLGALPAVAVTGHIDGGVQVNKAICVNSTQSASFVGDIAGTTFDCGTGFPIAPGDQITIVLVATGSTGGPSPSCHAAPFTEQEPNDDFPQSQNLGTLQSGGCITVAGNIDTGVGNPDAQDPNADFDYYLFSLVGVSRLNIDIAADRLIYFRVFDADTQARLEPQFPENGGIEVDIPAQTSRIIFRMSTDVPGSYTLTVADQSGIENAPLGAQTSGPWMIEDRP